jgi:outer membrane protein
MCYYQIEAQNEDIKQANLRILLNEVEINDAKNSFLPTLSLGASHNYNLGLAFDQISGQLVTGNKWSNNANLNISTRIPIFQNFTLRNRLKNSLLSLESSKIQKEQLLQTLKIDVLGKYIEVIANKRLYELSLKQLAFANAQLNQEKEKYTLGTNTSVDVAQAESSSANNKLSVIANLTSYSSSLITIKQLLGLPLSDSITLEEFQIDEINLPISIAENSNSTRNEIDPFIKSAELSIEQTRLNLKYAKAAYYPSLNFYGGYGTNYSSERTDFISGNYMPFWNQFNQNRNLNFGLSLSMPIFDAFKTKNNISRLKIDLETKQSELNKIKTEREKIWFLALQEYNKSWREHEILQVQLFAQEKNLLAIKERYDIGVSNAIEYNKALLDYNISESNAIKGKYTLIYNSQVLELLKGD